jgi:two-component system cell cycle response regulator DivK
MSKRILVVEDQPDNRQIIRDMLSPTDYEITEAENGEEALAAIAKQRPDLILMDIQLPIMDGYTATSRIKADPALRSIPIIAVTSYVLSGEEKKARAAGCDDYVPKPFSPPPIAAENSPLPAISRCVRLNNLGIFIVRRTALPWRSRDSLSEPDIDRLKE